MITAPAIEIIFLVFINSHSSVCGPSSTFLTSSLSPHTAATAFGHKHRHTHPRRPLNKTRQLWLRPASLPRRFSITPSSLSPYSPDRHSQSSRASVLEKRVPIRHPATSPRRDNSCPAPESDADRHHPAARSPISHPRSARPCSAHL